MSSDSSQSRRSRLIAAGGAGALFALAFPPADLGFLVFVALAPLMWVWQGVNPRRGALFGFVFGVSFCVVFGLPFFGVLVYWVGFLAPVLALPLIAAAAALFAGVGALVGMFAVRGASSPWLVAAIWVLMEGLRNRFPFGGVPWMEVGVTLHDFPAARALASIGGVPLITFLVVAVNGLLVDAVIAAGTHRRRPLVLAVTGLVAVVAVMVVVDLTRFEPTVTGELRFALLQGNDQDRDLTASEVSSGYLTRRHLELAQRLRGKFDLIVFPESALERDPEQTPALRASLVEIARQHDAVVVVNARYVRPDRRLSNANLVYEPDGRLQGVYAKQRLVPFGEYVPLRGYLPFMSEVESLLAYDYVPGDRPVMFNAGGHKFGTVICFESAFSSLVREYVREGAEAIVVSTNNRTYGRSGMTAQHLALSQMRAAETARPVLHASISGITGVVDAGGDVHDTSELFVNKITEGTIATTTGETLFVRLGDWVLLACGLALIAAAAATVWRGRRMAPVDSGS